MRNMFSQLGSIGSPIAHFRSSAFSPASLFAAGDLGFWYDPSDLTTMFVDTAGTTPVATSGQTVARVNDKSGGSNHATQATTAARPSYILDADGAFIQHDLVDDALTVSGLGALGSACTVCYVTRSEVRLLEDQTITDTYTLPKQEVAGIVVIDRALSFSEKVRLIRYMASKVEGVNYGAEIDRLVLIAINAVDVFVYDTSKDSDGGAWRTGALAQASSWWNETLNTTTRGARREFPAVAVIVAESNKVTIYDGDDPTLPMWMVFNQTVAPTGDYDWFRSGRTPSSVHCANGFLAFGTNINAYSGLCLANFVADDLIRYAAVNNGGRGKSISDRNANADLPSRLTVGLVNDKVNDVAMTVLPNAPIDPATGLPVPTIAVATAGGISVITDSGAVYDSADTDPYLNVYFENGGRLFAVRNTGLVRTDNDYFADGFAADTTYSTSSTPALLGAVSKVAA